MPENKLSENTLNDWTIIKTLAWTDTYFKDHFIDSPRLTAEILLAHCLGLKRLDLYLQHDRPLQKNELTVFKRFIRRRVNNEPVAYITGEKGFFESDFKVAPDVLIPRPDTETIVEKALKLLMSDPGNAGPMSVLELGTGSGAIIVSLAKASPGHLYFACDISVKALRVAKKNAENILSKIENSRISFFAGNWFSSLKQDRDLEKKFDLIISNPPYIPTKDIAELPAEIKQFEPLLALDGGTDGLDCITCILASAHNFLVPGGILLLEMGFDQKTGVRHIFNQCPQYQAIEFIKDMAGHNRVVLIKKSID